MDHLNEIPPQDPLREQYQDAGNFRTRVQIIQSLIPQWENFYRWVFDLIATTPDAQVLELGCGTGQLWLDNLERIPQDWNILLSDFSPGMLKETQHNLHQSNRPFAFQVIDAQEIPFEEARFDLLIANLMLYHVPDLPRALAEIQRVLKPDGSLYAATVNITGFAPLGKIMKDAGIPFEFNTKGFTIENGAEQLAHWFSHVTLSLLEGPSVLITEVEPFFAFIRTLLPQSHYSETLFQDLRDLIQQALRQQEGILWHMDIGLFKASDPKRPEHQ